MIKNCPNQSRYVVNNRISIGKNRFKLRFVWAEYFNQTAIKIKFHWIIVVYSNQFKWIEYWCSKNAIYFQNIYTSLVIKKYLKRFYYFSTILCLMKIRSWYCFIHIQKLKISDKLLSKLELSLTDSFSHGAIFNINRRSNRTKNK